MEAPNTRTTRGGPSNQSQRPRSENTALATLNDCSAKLCSSLRRRAFVSSGSCSGNFLSQKTRASSSAVEAERPSFSRQTKNSNSLSLKRAKETLCSMSGHISRLQPSTQRAEATNQARKHPRRQFINLRSSHLLPLTLYHIAEADDLVTLAGDYGLRPFTRELLAETFDLRSGALQ